jgi:hypothetical protein
MKKKELESHYLDMCRKLKIKVSQFPDNDLNEAELIAWKASRWDDLSDIVMSGLDNDTITKEAIEYCRKAYNKEI